MTEIHEKRRNIVQEQVASIENISLKMLELMSSTRMKIDEAGVPWIRKVDERESVENRLCGMKDELEKAARDLDSLQPDLPRKLRKLRDHALELAKTARQMEETLSTLKKQLSQ